MTAGSRSRWIVAVAALLAASGTASLGLWQLDRAKQKITLASALDTRATLPPITPRQLAGSALAAGQTAGTAPTFEQQLAAQLDRRIELSGWWINEASVVLDNRQMNGRPGFYLYTPLRLSDGCILGALVIQSYHADRTYSDEDLVLFGQIADHSSTALEKLTANRTTLVVASLVAAWLGIGSLSE